MNLFKNQCYFGKKKKKPWFGHLASNELIFFWGGGLKYKTHPLSFINFHFSLIIVGFVISVI